MDQSQLKSLTERFLDAWNTQDVERVVAFYTDDLEYRDPNTRGAVEGADAMRRYLTKLFAAWEMTWALRESYVHENGVSGSFLWQATFRRSGGEEMVEADGMDLVVLEGDKLKRNDVYFDRAVLASLLPEPAQATA